MEFEIFQLEHQLTISLEEVYHLAPIDQTTHEIRQHHHVTLRSGRTKRSLTFCATTMNWEANPMPSSLVLANLAAEARLFSECEGDYPTWAATFECDTDSRGAERRFRQTPMIVEALQNLLGEGGYSQLIKLSAEAADVFTAIDDD